MQPASAADIAPPPGDTFVANGTPIPHPGDAEGERIALAEATAPITIGRSDDNSVTLPHPQVSLHHARITRTSQGDYVITDLGSTNGTYVNGYSIRQAKLVPGVEVRIGPYRFVFTGTSLTQYDESKSIRVDALDLRKTMPTGRLVRDRRQVVLDDVSLSILPGSFVAVVGASGAGKTMLLNALNGQSPADHGTVLYNQQDFYRHTAAFTSSFGYVPQDDIIHANLTVERALYYAARLRLPKDFSRRQILERVRQVMDDVELTPQHRQLIADLSGGQRKRASIAVELLADPPVFFLDEPTSGLDPGLDRKMMLLLRRLADRGHTIIMSTHATANIEVCDAVCFLAPGGRLVYYGPPQELKRYFGQNDYAEIYNEVAEDPAGWANRFRASPDYRRYVQATRQQAEAQATISARRSFSWPIRPHRRGPFSQFIRLSERYIGLVTRDRMNVLILLAQAPIIALLTVVLATRNILQTTAQPLQPGGFPPDMNAQATLFIMVCSAVWFGTINSAREIVKEEPIYRRERAIGLRVGPYIWSKVVVLGALVAVQSFLLLFIVGLKTGYPANGLFLVGTRGAFIEMYVSLLLMGFVGLMMGLLISVVAPNTDRAVSLVPLVLIPQIIFANVVFVLKGFGGALLSYFMPARWGMQAMGSIARLHDRFTDHGDSPFYAANQLHLLGFWAALVALSILYFTLTLWLQRRKDILHPEKEESEESEEQRDAA
jgi:ABC transport system ATP-binding/permease protein